MRATYRRPHGTEQFLGFYDVHADCLSGLFRRRKRVVEVSEAFRRVRACYPRKRLLVIMDNLRNVHDHPRFLALLRRLRITPVWTPTEASWLNLIEAQFGISSASPWPIPMTRATGFADSESTGIFGIAIGRSAGSTIR
jgi:transposase